MLIKFKVNRFRGFAQEICWDLSHPSQYEFNTHAIKNGVVKNGIIFGPNGCGKSNFSKAVFDIIYHLTQKHKLPDYYNSCIYVGAPNKLMEFEYTFQFGETIMEYVYSKNGDGILITESLKVDGRPICSKQPGQPVFFADEFLINEDTRQTLSTNANNVSIVGFLISFYPLDEKHYLIKLRDFVEGMLWFVNLDYRDFMGFETSRTLILEFIIKEKLVDKFKEFLQNISGQEYHFAEPQKDDKMLYCMIGENKVPFGDIASTGTLSISLLFFWLQKLNKASFVFIDEFDAFYHFDLSSKVCKELFKLDCQVFTTSHNTSLMSNDLLRPDCFFILNDNQIKPFYQCTDKELRFAHNLEKMYRGKALEV